MAAFPPHTSFNPASPAYRAGRRGGTVKRTLRISSTLPDAGGIGLAFFPDIF
jgi:hypothetical protein